MGIYYLYLHEVSVLNKRNFLGYVNCQRSSLIGYFKVLVEVKL